VPLALNFVIFVIVFVPTNFSVIVPFELNVVVSVSPLAFFSVMLPSALNVVVFATNPCIAIRFALFIFVPIRVDVLSINSTIIYPSPHSNVSHSWKEVIIPSSINFTLFRVSSIQLTSVIVSGNSLQRIEESAFGDCRSLAYVEIPNTITYVDKEAFEDCNANVKVVIRGAKNQALEASLSKAGIRFIEYK
jgi:hypothetical protein